MKNAISSSPRTQPPKPKIAVPTRTAPNTPLADSDRRQYANPPMARLNAKPTISRLPTSRITLHASRFT